MSRRILSSAAPVNDSLFAKIMTAGSSPTNRWYIIIGAIVLFFILAAVVYYYYGPSRQTYHENHERVPVGTADVNNQTAEVMLFFADWCPHCKKAKPIWNEVRDEYENKTINGYRLVFTEVDCSTDNAETEKMRNQFNIEGFPTIKLVKDGQVIEYDANITKEVLVKFLNTVI